MSSSVAPEYSAFISAARTSDRLPPPPDRLAAGQVTDSVFVDAKEASALLQVAARQNPAAQIPWDEEKVYAYYAGQGWSRSDVDFNIFDVYEEDSTNHTTFAPTSIMQYAIPDSLTRS